MRTSKFFKFSQTQSQKHKNSESIKEPELEAPRFWKFSKNGNNKLFNFVSFKNLEAEVLKIKEPTDTGYNHCGIVLWTF